jgi:hypothetical protein
MNANCHVKCFEALATTVCAVIAAAGIALILGAGGQVLAIIVGAWLAVVFGIAAGRFAIFLTQDIIGDWHEHRILAGNPREIRKLVQR